MHLFISLMHQEKNTALNIRLVKFLPYARMVLALNGKRNVCMCECGCVWCFIERCLQVFLNTRACVPSIIWLFESVKKHNPGYRIYVSQIIQNIFSFHLYKQVEGCLSGSLLLCLHLHSLWSPQCPKLGERDLALRCSFSLNLYHTNLPEADSSFRWPAALLPCVQLLISSHIDRIGLHSYQHCMKAPTSPHPLWY